VLDSQVIRRISATIKEEVTRDWRKLHDEKLFDLCSWLDIKMIKSRSAGWAKHVASKRHIISAYRFSVEKSERMQPDSSRFYK
jgi:hypothetical protein